MQPNSTAPTVAAAPAANGAAIPALEISGLAVAVGAGSSRIPLIHRADITLAKGECLGVVGESGCGKTVTFLSALGLMPKSAKVSGSVRIAGRDILGLGERQLELIRGREIGMIFQDPQSALNPVRTIGRQLIEHVYAQAKTDNCIKVYWVTHETNATAISLYQQVAERSGFIQFRKEF